ncbi:MAG TPA: PQQ-binding-like beta-propeller repeat protein, partial [Pyrinomonadaceae bacterium]|nr:PQQ-binding-like beta-propeller repeat protein [Pyrinomonadaceae bacterium]
MKKLPLLLFGLICTLFTTTVSAQVNPEQARNFQIDASHTGAISTQHLTPPLRQRWVVDFGWPVSYPLIADGKVFVTVKNIPITSGTTLYALDATNGSTLWLVNLGGFSFWGAACYENGSVFALNGSGLLRSFDGATGNVNWSVQLPGGFTFAAPPTVFDGAIYVSGPNAVHKVDAASGAILWTTPVVSGDKSSPVVTSEGVYVSYTGTNVYKLDPATGAQIWNYSEGSGAGGRTPVLYNGALYVRDSFDFTQDNIFDAQTGTITGQFSARNIPAFANNTAFFMDSSFLFARELIFNSFLWGFIGDNSLQSG